MEETQILLYQLTFISGGGGDGGGVITANKAVEWSTAVGSEHWILLRRPGDIFRCFISSKILTEQKHSVVTNCIIIKQKISV